MCYNYIIVFERRFKSMENENTNSGYEQTISILEIISLLLSKAIWIILAGIIVAAGVGVFTKVAITPKYESYSTLSVFNRTANAGNNVSSSEIVAAQYLADTYTHILQSDTVCSAVIDELNKTPAYAAKELTTKDLQKLLKVTTLSSTQLLKVTITTTDPVSPSLLKNCFVGFFIGALLLSAIYILKMLMDTTIHEVEDVEKITKLPILGAMPSMVVTEDQKFTPWKLGHHTTVSLNEDADSI